MAPGNHPADVWTRRDVMFPLHQLRAGHTVRHEPRSGRLERPTCEGGREHFTKGAIPVAVMFGTGWAVTGAWLYHSLTSRAFQFDTGIYGEE